MSKDAERARSSLVLFVLYYHVRQNMFRVNRVGKFFFVINGMKSLFFIFMSRQGTLKVRINIDKLESMLIFELRQKSTLICCRDVDGVSQS